jgi:prepilin-type N-terminal cleavage/methylation domain-containing protein
MRADRGFSLLEVLVAMGVITTVLTGVAPLFAMSIRTNIRARDASYASMFAAQKIEQLRAGGDPVRSPDGTLANDTPGFVEYLDADGMVLAGDVVGPPPRTAYIRRWSVEPAALDPLHTLVIHVVVTRLRSSWRPEVSARGPDEARIVALKARRAP